jgi:hypothetical protein
MVAFGAATLADYLTSRASHRRQTGDLRPARASCLGRVLRPDVLASERRLARARPSPTWYRRLPRPPRSISSRTPPPW